ncbi:UNVERIFIED_CONTAM: hypothetical protein Sradi_3785700 [Sesamum radiatum]|uniref:Uncharacterized protein n=1 Tax=Sesamum radiatum TaxID=300843 RepID=A0AAW2Q026_SESRA
MAARATIVTSLAKMKVTKLAAKAYDQGIESPTTLDVHKSSIKCGILIYLHPSLLAECQTPARSYGVIPMIPPTSEVPVATISIKVIRDGSGELRFRQAGQIQVANIISHSLRNDTKITKVTLSMMWRSLLP